MGFDFIMIVPLLPSCAVNFSLSLGVRYLFWYVPAFITFVVVVDGCSAVSCDFGVFVRRGVLTSFYSAILAASPQLDCCGFLMHKYE